MSKFQAWAATTAGGELQPQQIEFGSLGSDQVEIAVEHCGICHSDLSMLDNEWGRSSYPIVPGHEVVGRITALGDHALGLSVGQRVGLGWFSSSCMHCDPCTGGDNHLCDDGQETIVGRHGGFAEKVRCHWRWALPLPETMEAESAGPLFCGGITVFNPIVMQGVQPTDRVGVIGIGGLGHMALQFLNKWGCEVTAFTSSEAKADEARALGAHHIVNSRDRKALKAVAGQFDFLLVTVNVSLDWPLYLAALAPRGRLHVVGAVLEPMAIPAFSLIGGQKTIAGSPLGSPAVTKQMLEFCARHQIAPQVERYPMSEVNAAIEHLRAGKARYRIVLDQ